MAFTLIEVLVVVAIIALLIAILIPSLERSRAQARSTKCQANLHQIGVAIIQYAMSNNDCVPRDAPPGEIHWTQLVARNFGDKTYYPNANLLPVDKMEVYHCPERVKFLPRPFLDYVANGLDPDGRNQQLGRWSGVRYMKIRSYPVPAEVVYAIDAEQEAKNTDPNPDDTLQSARENWEKRDIWMNPANWKTEGGIDRMDTWKGAHLPEGKEGVNVTDKIGLRRVARKMHLGSFTNAVFLDAHAGGLPLASKERYPSDVDKYGLWLKRFGIQKFQQIKNEPLN